MKCKCDDVRHSNTRETAWHRAYCNWYDHKQAGNTMRAGLWGHLADALCP